jgi:hypothetical protein
MPLFLSMKSPHLKIWLLCLAVAASAVLIKLALMVSSVGGILMVSTPLIFFGPRCGIVMDRHRGGTGVTGGVIAGILTGIALSAFLNIVSFRAGHPFGWLEVAFSTTLLVSFETFRGWLWGRYPRSWPISMANRTATKPGGSEI